MWIVVLWSAFILILGWKNKQVFLRPLFLKNRWGRQAGRQVFIFYFFFTKKTDETTFFSWKTNAAPFLFILSIEMLIFWFWHEWNKRGHFFFYSSLKKRQMRGNSKQRREGLRNIFLIWPSSKIFYWLFQGGASFVDHICYFCLVLLCFHARLFVDALWSPAGEGLTY